MKCAIYYYNLISKKSAKFEDKRRDRAVYFGLGAS